VRDEANARLTSVTSPFGAVTTITYNDAASPPTIVTSVNGRWTPRTLGSPRTYNNTGMELERLAT